MASAALGVQLGEVSDVDYIVTGTQLPLSMATRMGHLGPRVLRF